MATSIGKPRHASDVSSKRKRGIHSQFYDPRPSKARHIDSDSVAKLKNNLCAINAKIPFAIMLLDNPTDLPTVNTLTGPVAKGSILHTQHKRFGTTTMNNNAQSTSTSYTLQSSQLTKVNDQSQNSEKVIQHSTTTSPNLQQSSQSKEITYHSPGKNTTEHFTAKAPVYSQVSLIR